MRLEDAIKSNKFRSEAHKAALNILFSAWWLKTALSAELKNFGLTHEQYNVLRILKGKHPEHLCVRDIASRMIEKNSNVPRILDRLLKKKLIKRNTSRQDRRETVISLTNLGLSVLENSDVKISHSIDNSIHLSRSESKVLNDLLERMREK